MVCFFGGTYSNVGNVCSGGVDERLVRPLVFNVLRVGFGKLVHIAFAFLLSFISEGWGPEASS